MSPIWLDPGEEVAEFIGTAADRANAKIKDVNARAPHAPLQCGRASSRALSLHFLPFMLRRAVERHNFRAIPGSVSLSI